MLLSNTDADIATRIADTDLDRQQGAWHPAKTLPTASLLDALAGLHSKVN